MSNGSLTCHTLTPSRRHAHRKHAPVNFAGVFTALSMLQVIRMLRLAPGDIDQITAFQAMHEDARRENFGCMFRSPTLWEDMVKSITLCNCGCAFQ